MEHPNDQNNFSYSYSAKEQAELKRIREKYAPVKGKKEDKMARLRRLDRSVTGTARWVSLTIGIVGILILGFGMSLAMSDLSAILGSAQSYSVLIGALVGTVGGTIAGAAYPIYNAVVAHKRKKIAPEILRLTEELLK